MVSKKVKLISLVGIASLAILGSFQNCSKNSPSSTVTSSSKSGSGATIGSPSSTGGLILGQVGQGSNLKLIDIWHGSDLTKTDRVYAFNEAQLNNHNAKYLAFRVYSQADEPDMVPVYQCLAKVNGVDHHHFLSNLENCERPSDHSVYDTIQTGLLGYLFKNPPITTAVADGRKTLQLIRCFYDLNPVKFHMASIDPNVECGDPGFLSNGKQKDGVSLGYYVD
jgi:hypothetical protein